MRHHYCLLFHNRDGIKKIKNQPSVVAVELLASGASVSLATETRGDTERDGGGGVGVWGDRGDRHRSLSAERQKREAELM